MKKQSVISGNERPVRRNLLITSILYYFKDVESFDSGLKRIADACDESKCRFEFKILKSRFVLTTPTPYGVGSLVADSVIFYRDESIATQDAVQDAIQDFGCLVKKYWNREIFRGFSSYNILCRR